MNLTNETSQKETSMNVQKHRAKHLNQRRAVTVAAIFVAGLLPVTHSFAQADWPNKPIRLYVGFAAGGPTDVFARVLARQLSEQLKQTVLVDNKPGANANLAAEAVVASPADGYTFLYNSSSIAISAGLYKNLKYDVRKDLAPVSMVMALPTVLVATSSVPVSNPAEFVSYLTANGAKSFYASGGAGNAQHLGMAMILRNYNLQATHTPYKGSSQAYPDLISGRVQFMLDAVPSLMPHIKDKSLKPIALATAKRLPELPGIPTLTESGMPGFELEAWYGVMAPARTPEAIIRKMSAEIAKAMDSEEVKRTIVAQGARPLETGPEKFTPYLRAEIERYSTIIKAIDLKLD